MLDGARFGLDSVLKQGGASKAMKIVVTRFTVLIALIFGLAYNAHAINITPTSGILGTTRFEGTETSNSQVLVEAATLCGCTLTSQYKQNVGGGEEGPLAGSYNTTFTPAVEPGAFQITYTGGTSVGPTAYLIVKDGNQTPAYYLFNLTALGWNGTDPINGSGFWDPGNGAVSHVELFGTTATTLPAPSSLILLGSGMLAMGIAQRKRQQK